MCDWEKINQIFFATLEFDPACQEEMLASMCQDDRVLLDEVSSLLAAHRQAHGFLNQPAGDPRELVGSVIDRLLVGQRAGPYRITAKIGHGGMGTVYSAEREDNQYEKKVAIKFIRAGLDSPAGLRQFCRERQILANLDHPYIARLLDGGATEEGLPFLIMQYIEGQPLDIYCDIHRLGIRDRLRLFLNVCSAVQYAHQEGVIHRDLKPSNILVNAHGEPRLLDFGVAKLSARTAPGGNLTATTCAFQVTTEYASPEQLRHQEVTSATDIYSLGVILYELLCGQRPFQVEGQTPDERVRMICNESPERPSRAILGKEWQKSRPQQAEDRERRGRIAEQRGASVRSLSNLLAGDLDNIVLMALRKASERRYSSVALLADDIHRYLSKLPVRARADHLAYRSMKFFQRHRPGVVAAACVVCCLLAGAIAARRQTQLLEVERLQREKQVQEMAHEAVANADRARKAELEAGSLRQQAYREKLHVQTALFRQLNRALELHPNKQGPLIKSPIVFFAAGRTTLSPDSREHLARLAAVMIEHPGLKVSIVGHTDSDGDAAYNQALSEERASSVRTYLMEQGIPRTAIKITGYGKATPIASNESAYGKQRNRRVEMLLYGESIGSSSTHGRATQALAHANVSTNVVGVVYNHPHPGPLVNLALNKPSQGSTPCNAHEGADKAFNGSVTGGNLDKWCSSAAPAFLEVDLGATYRVASFVLRHAGAGGETQEFNTKAYDIDVSLDGVNFTTVVHVTDNAESVTVHNIPPSAARYVRLRVTVPGQLMTMTTSRIYEFEAYSSPYYEQDDDLPFHSLNEL